MTTTGTETVHIPSVTRTAVTADVSNLAGSGLERLARVARPPYCFASNTVTNRQEPLESR
jgi:hypothetical protein